MRVESERVIAGKESKKEIRFFISSCEKLEAQKALNVVRTHWEVENKLHWVLDVSFGEDRSRVRKGNGAENFALLRKFALNLVKREHTSKRSIKGKRLKASWDATYMEKVLLGARS